METTHRRPNGRLAACDPCRARKVSCDHREPVCTRCFKKNIGSRCNYSGGHSAIKRVSREPSSQLSDGLITASSVAEPPPLPPLLPPLQLPLPVELDLATQSSVSPPPVVGLPTPRPSARLGHTSVLEETQSSLLLLGGSAGSPDDVDYNPDTPNQPAVPFQELPYMIRQMCLVVLRGLPGQRDAQMAYLDGTVEPRGWTYIAVDRIVRNLRRMFAASRHLGEAAALEALARMLCDNTARPFQDDYPDCKAWIEAFCSANSLRWESIALLWAHMERASDMFDALNKTLLVRSANNTSVEAARINLGYCIRLVQHFSNPSVLLLDMIRRLATLHSLVDGELSMSSWDTGASSIAFMTFLGTQTTEEDEAATYTPTFYSEYKRRIAVHVFTRDKLGVAFTGRPPFISHRYFSAPMPLDIADEDLLDPTRLQRAAKSLDANGWNTAGRLYASTAIRARFMISMIRDELIEATLGKASLNVDYLLDLRSRQCSLADQFPDGLRLCASDLASPDVPPNVAYMKAFTHLEHLQNIFFAERLLQRCNYVGNGELLIVSVTMVSLTLHFWMNQDRFSMQTMRRNFEWIVLSYGAPGAGVLCQELLYPTFRGNHPLDVKVTRSSIIQQLSVLIGFFDWVRDAAPNATLCRDCSAIIQRVLDYTLNMAAAGGAGLGANGAAAVPELLDWGVFDQPDFSFELMDTFDWLR
ncbi:C6 transcription factor [Cordyceps fumosorosea ARSEF 2679]|uniref:C6 transcription factor n=1 Tax=Cordyceps fumosorosea (strain ARSEF 2679) TaxID=1081104 RepID=A0A162IB61_CORFA|nr:C6 transcription factor [Cordyceps fumosorosea ARSEF 2679]OAA54665.1 C6 transcription factor [Cordyceps fumosorosea ARSEF 2679]